jgi:hypothetical protein
MAQTTGVELLQRCRDFDLFITADATDWPLQLYERLGFDAVGISLGFRIKPEPVG